MNGASDSFAAQRAAIFVARFPARRRSGSLFRVLASVSLSRALRLRGIAALAPSVASDMRRGSFAAAV
jgi:hypothetical protein